MDNLSKEYLADVLRMMQEDYLIDGLTFAKAWGNEHILMSDYGDIRITPDGIRYVKENGTMQKVRQTLFERPERITSLVTMVLGE